MALGTGTDWVTVDVDPDVATIELVAQAIAGSYPIPRRVQWAHRQAARAAIVALQADGWSNQAGELDRLAEFVIQEIPGEPSRSEGVVDTVIRLLRDGWRKP